MDKTELKYLIYQSFWDITYPNITLHVANAHDNLDYENDDKYKKLDYYWNWKDIPEKDFLKCPYALAYLEPDGLKYYIPKLMIWTIDNYEKNVELIMEYLIYTLCPSKSQLECHNRFKLFDENQNIACANFLKYILENDSNGKYFSVKFIEKAFKLKWQFFIK